MKEEIIKVLEEFCKKLRHSVEPASLDSKRTNQLIKDLASRLSQFDIQSILDELPSCIQFEEHTYWLTISKDPIGTSVVQYFNISKKGSYKNSLTRCSNLLTALTQLKEKLKQEGLI